MNPYNEMYQGFRIRVEGEKFPHVTKAEGMYYYVGQHEIRKLHPTGEVKKFTRDEIRKVLPNETATIVEIATIQNIVFGVFEQLGILAD